MYFRAWVRFKRDGSLVTWHEELSSRANAYAWLEATMAQLGRKVFAYGVVQRARIETLH